MGDIKFKIDGNSVPFVAELYTNGTLSQKKIVEYSGTTVILGQLCGSTCYCMTITDNVGNIFSTGFTTCVALTPPELPVKTICLAGTSTCPTSTVNIITPTKCVCIYPSLSSGQVINNLHFCIDTCNISNTQNSVTIYRNNVCVTGFLNCGTTTYSLSNVTSSDSICYDMSTTCIAGSTGDICGCSKLIVTAPVVSGFSGITANNTKTTSLSIVAPVTTTTTTTLEPVSVFLCGCADLGSNPFVKRCVCSKLGTSRPLAAGESFRLCYMDQACSRSVGVLPDTIQSCSFICVNGVTAKCNLVTSCLDGIDNISMTNCAYITVNCDNINNIIFYDIALSSSNNDNYSYTNGATSTLYSISYKVGANFQLGTPTTYSGFNRVGTTIPVS
jgi:hypothetical protein